MRFGGFVLPVVLLLLLALSGLAVAALAMARLEVEVERADRAGLVERAGWEAALGALGAGAFEDPAGGTGALRLRPLGGGFVLARHGAGTAPAAAAVLWVLDPDSVAADFPPAAEVGWGMPGEGIRPGEGECAAGPFEAAVRVRREPGPPEPDPPLDPSPRLGPVGVPSLVGRARIHLAAGDPLPAADGPAVAEAAPGSRMDAGSGEGVLLSGGSLTLAGDVRWAGLVLVEGDLTLEGEALLEGVALVGGRLRVEDEAELMGCRAAAARALAAPELAAPFFFPGGRLLGRF